MTSSEILDAATAQVLNEVEASGEELTPMKMLERVGEILEENNAAGRTVTTDPLAMSN